MTYIYNFVGKKESNLTPFKNILIIGAGNVAVHLAKGLKKANLKVTLTGRAHSQNRKTASLLGVDYSTSIEGHNHPVDLYIVAVNDASIASVVDEIPKNTPVCYTSGSIDLAQFTREQIGVFYPLQSFSKDRTLTLNTVPFFIEAKTKLLTQQLVDLANQLSSSVHLADSETRGHLHLAAVFVNNFTNHMFTLADDYMSEKGLDSSHLNPLMQETVRKLEYMKAADAQTGPARRNDINVLNRHNELLKDSSSSEVYRVLSNSIINYYKEKK